jgi:hypothetical protein
MLQIPSGDSAILKAAKVGCSSATRPEIDRANIADGICCGVERRRRGMTAEAIAQLHRPCTISPPANLRG